MIQLKSARKGVFLLLFIISFTIQSQTWQGGGTDWNDPANWSSNPSLPSNGSTIYIDGVTATVDVASAFRAGEIHILNEGELIISNTLDAADNEFTFVNNGKLTVTTGGLFTSEFIFVSNGGEIEVNDGELDVGDKLGIDNGTLSISGGVLELNGSESQSEETEIYNSSTVDITGGEVLFNSSIIVTDSDFTTASVATLRTSNDNRNLEFHSSTASLNGTIDMFDEGGSSNWGDLSLFGSSIVDLQADLNMQIDDLILNDDGQNSTLNVYGDLLSFDDLLFDTDDSNDTPGDEDRIVIKDGGSLIIEDRFQDAARLNSGSGIHVENGGNLEIAIIENYTAEEAYGIVVTSDEGATVSMEGEGELPVELTLFKAESSKGRINLEWATAVEINNDYFDLLKSSDGINFNPIGRISGVGNSNKTVEYRFSDSDVSAGIYYYQLKQVDFDGTAEYHEILSIEFNRENKNEFIAYPNPITSDELSIRTSINVTNPSMVIYSVTGDLLLQLKLNPGSNWSVEKTSLNLGEGTYFLKIYDEISNIEIGSSRIKIVD